MERERDEGRRSMENGGKDGRKDRYHLPINQTSKPRLWEVERQAEDGSDGQWQGWDQAIVS